jgi:hypothetical protein
LPPSPAFANNFISQTFCFTYTYYTFPSFLPPSSILSAGTTLLRTYHRPHSSLYKTRTRLHNFLLESWPLTIRPIGCPETSVRNYHYLLRDNPGEHSRSLSPCFICWLNFPCATGCQEVGPLSNSVLKGKMQNHATFRQFGIMYFHLLPAPVAARSLALVYGRSLAETAVSNPSGAIDACLLSVLCAVS